LQSDHFIIKTWTPGRLPLSKHPLKKLLLIDFPFFIEHLKLATLYYDLGEEICSKGRNGYKGMKNNPMQKLSVLKQFCTYNLTTVSKTLFIDEIFISRC